MFSHLLKPEYMGGSKSRNMRSLTSAGHDCRSSKVQKADRKPISKSFLWIVSFSQREILGVNCCGSQLDSPRHHLHHYLVTLRTTDRHSIYHISRPEVHTWVVQRETASLDARVKTFKTVAGVHPSNGQLSGAEHFSKKLLRSQTISKEKQCDNQTLFSLSNLCFIQVTNPMRYPLSQ